MLPYSINPAANFKPPAACDENTHKTLQHERRLAAEAKLKEAAESPPPPNVNSRESQPPENGGAARKIAISIRSSVNRDPIVLRVKTSITMANLLKHFMKELGKAPTAKTRLQFDGEDVDTESTLAAVMEAADFDEDEEEIQFDVAGL